VDTDEYDRRLRGARVGVQLRRDARGQRSAAVADLRARGIPVVTDFEDGGTHLDEDALVREITVLLNDDAAWRIAADRSLGIARGWTFRHVARALRAWLERVSEIEPSSVVDAASLG